jgi:GMP synthase (glutamine-hydrolysing)
MIRIHHLQHVAFESLGSIATWASNRGCALSATHLYNGDSFPAQDDFDCLVIMGGPMNIYEYDLYPWLTAEKKFIEQSIKNRKTVLGICLGAQLIADVLGQKVYAGRQKEIGWFPIYKTKQARQTPDADFFPSKAVAFHWHGDTFDIPGDALHLAESEACSSQGFIYNRQVVGLQFHLETTRRSAGLLIENCADEIVAGRFIQSADEMLTDDSRFETVNHLMDSLLESLPLFASAHP